MKTRIKNHVKANFPILSIVTSEETRTLGMLRKIAEDLNRKVYLWSVTRGVIEMSNGSTGKPVKDIDDPMAFLDMLSESLEESLWIMLDIGPFLENPTFERAIKDRLQDYKQRKTLIMISKRIKIPEGMDHLVTTIKSDLPDRDTLRVVLDGVVSDNELEPLDDDNLEKTITALSGLTTDQAEDALALSLVESKGKIDPSIIMREKCDQLSNYDFLQVIGEVEQMENLGGLKELKNYISMRKDVFSAKARKFGLPNPLGILLTGVSGCGKSLAAKVVPSVLKIPLIQLKIGSIHDKYVGGSQHNTETAIKIVEAMSPCVLWIDELDKVLASGGSADTTNESTKQVMGILLNWMEEKTVPVYLTATANDIENISNSFPELLRKGRWDEIFFIDLPDVDEREEILKVHIMKQGGSPDDFPTKSMAKQMMNFSGAEIAAACREGKTIAFSMDKEMDDETITIAADEIVPLFEMSKTSIQGLRKWADGRARRASRKSQKSKNGRKVDV